MTAPPPKPRRAAPKPRRPFVVPAGTELHVSTPGGDLYCDLTGSLPVATRYLAVLATVVPVSPDTTWICTPPKGTD